MVAHASKGKATSILKSLDIEEIEVSQHRKSA
jgi:hypothetical protein